MNNIHTDLQFGKPPLTSVSFLEEQTNIKRLYSLPPPASEPKTSTSDDTLSTFSCVGDLLPDEAADVNLIEAAGTDNDFVAIKRIAQVLAKRRNIDSDTVMPKLLELFVAQSFESERRSSSLPTGLGKSSLLQQHVHSSVCRGMTNVVKKEIVRCSLQTIFNSHLPSRRNYCP